MLNVISLKGWANMGKLKNLETGFGAVEVLLILVIVGLLGFTGWYVWHAKQSADKTLSADNSTTPTFNKKTSTNTKTSESQVADPTENWVSFTSKDGKFSLKYPGSWVLTANCTANNLFSAGPTPSSAGTCNSNSGGNPEITILDTDHPCLGPASGGYNTKQVRLSGANGVEYTSTSGTKYIEYCLSKPSKQGVVYEAKYTQLTSYLDASSDFNVMVTKTLNFN